MNHSSDLVKGFFFIFASALMYASMPILGKLAYQLGLLPETIVFLRYSLAFVILSLYLGLGKREPVLSLKPLVFLQGVFFVAGSLLYFFSLRYLTAGLTTVIFFSHPVLVAVLAQMIFKEKLSSRLVAGLMIAVIGILLISGLTMQGLRIHSTGFIYCIIGSVCYALYSLVGQINLERSSPLSLTATLVLVGIIVIPVFFPQGMLLLLSLTLEQLLIGLAMALLNTVLAITFFLRGVQLMGASRSSLVSTLEPVLTLLLAFLLLGERLSPMEMLGSLCVITSMILAVTGRSGSDEAFLAGRCIDTDG